MKILLLLENLGVEKTTIFIETVKALVERGAEIHIVIASQPEHYVRESYYDEEPNVRVDVLESVDNRVKAVGGLKELARKYKITERISWTVFNFAIQWRFWIRSKTNRKDEDYIFETFLSPAMRSFTPREQYDYIWTTDEHSLLWAEWINKNSEVKYQIVHHSFELYWEHYSLPAHKHWQYFKQYALTEKARTILQRAEIIIIQDEERWNVLCKYTGLNREREKFLWPLSIKDYPVNIRDDIYQKMNIARNKKIIFYPTFIAPERGNLELVRMTQRLDSRFVTVLHAFTGIQNYYLTKIKDAILFPDKIVISITTLQYQQLVDMHSNVWCVFLFYGEEDNNNKYIVNASNKLVMALQAGKPVITTGNQTLAKLCSEYECGIALSGWVEEEFINAVRKLEQNYELYCKNARRCYEERFNIKPYADEIYNRLLTGI